MHYIIMIIFALILICVVFIWVNKITPKNTPVSIQQFGIFSVGLPVKVIGGIHYKKEGIITKIIDNDPECYSSSPDLYIHIYVKLEDGTETSISENLLKLQ